MNKAMPIIKDANYWKEYNAKRKEYLLEKQKQRRAQGKSQVVDNNSKVVINPAKESCIQPMNTTEPIVIKKQNDYNLNTTNDYNQDKKVVDMITTKKCIQPKNTLTNQEQEINNLKAKLSNSDSCPLNHYSFNQLFKETSEQVKSDYQQLYSQYPQTARLCINCRTQERNYQLLRQLLADYAKKTKYHCLSCSEPTKRYSEDNKYECFYPHCPFSTDCKKDLNAHEKTH